MPVIKSNLAPVSASPFSMTDIEGAARRILLRARQQAEQLLAAAQAEAEQMKMAAVEEGRAQGQQEGLVAGREAGRQEGHDEALAACREELGGLVTALSSAAGQIDASRRELQSAAVAEVADLAIAIAQRVIKCQAAIDPKVLTANLTEAMALVIQAADVRIFIHPDQMGVLERELPHLKLRWPNLKHVELVADDSLSPGGCRLGTAHGEVDADLEGQLDRVVGEMMKRPEEPRQEAGTRSDKSRSDGAPNPPRLPASDSAAPGASD
jgi:flagellar assembly protein FliH